MIGETGPREHPDSETIPETAAGGRMTTMPFEGTGTEGWRNAAGPVNGRQEDERNYISSCGRSGFGQSIWKNFPRGWSNRS